MNPVTITLINALLSAVFGAVSSLLVFRFKFGQEEDRYRKRKVEQWEDEALQELESARQILIDITSYRSHGLSSSRYDDIPPDEVAQEKESPKFERIDIHVTRIEELLGRIPEKHDNVSYYFTEISRQYRGAPESDIDQSQFDRWRDLMSFVSNAKDKIKENRGDN